MSKTKRERFEDVAGGRVNRAISALLSLQKCSNTYNYEYSEEDVRKMITTLRKQLDELKMSFDKGLIKNKGEFKF
jgi:hypothetical protein